MTSNGVTSDENGTKRASGFSRRASVQCFGRRTRLSGRPDRTAVSGVPSIGGSPDRVGRVAAGAPEATVAVVQAQPGGDEELPEALVVPARDVAHPGQHRQDGRDDGGRHPAAEQDAAPHDEQHAAAEQHDERHQRHAELHRRPGGALVDGFLRDHGGASGHDVAGEGGGAADQRAADQHVGHVGQARALEDHLEAGPDDRDRHHRDRDRDEDRVDVGDRRVDLVEALGEGEAGQGGAKPRRSGRGSARVRDASGSGSWALHGSVGLAGWRSRHDGHSRRESRW